MSEKFKKQITTEQKAKRKKVIWGTFWATAISAVLAAGISIPLVQASKALPAPTPILDEKSSIIKIIQPDGSIKTLTYGELDKNPTLTNKNKNIFDSIEKNIAKYLYEKEYEASLWYQAVYNADKAKTDEKSFALDSIDKIKEKVQKEIDDLKRQYQKQYGLEQKWEEKFLEEISKPSWGSSKNEKQALEYRVNLEINKNAYRRYKTEVNTDWTYNELKNGILANKDVFYEYNGKRVEIAKKGQKIFLPFAHENKNYVLPAEDSIESQTNSQASIKIPMFVTTSFVKEFRNPERFIKPWIDRKQAILSEFSLSAHQDTTGAEKPWIVTKAEIINLLKFSAYPENDTHNKLKLAIDALNDFRGFSTLIKNDNITSDDERHAKNDQTLIEYLSADKANASKFGSKGFVNLKQAISSSEPSSYFGLLSILLGDAQTDKGIYKYTQKNDLFKDLKKKLIEVLKSLSGYNNLETDFKKKLESALNTEPTSKEKKADYVEEYAKYNNEVEKIINNLEDKEFNKLFGNAFKDVFVNGNKDNKINAIYKVGENFVSVSPKGILIQNLHKFDTVEAVQKLIVKDLAIKSKANYKNTFTSELFNLNTIFADILDTTYQINDLLSQDTFKEYLKQQKFTPIDSDKEKNFDDADIKGALNYISTLEQTNKATIVNKKYGQIKDFIKKQINDNLVADFEYDTNTNKFIIKPHDNKDIISYLFDIIVKYVLE
ncbi:HinT-interacting membrane complex protein P80 [Mycoplasma sp. 2261]